MNKTLTWEESCRTFSSGFRGYKASIKVKPPYRQYIDAIISSWRDNTTPTLQDRIDRYANGKQNVKKYKRALSVK